MANASGSPHFPPKSQQIKILTNEDRISADDHGGDDSPAVYYGGATGTVPFVWESQPGTPKHKSSHTPSLPPPLTPPPSHQFITSPRTNMNITSHKNNSKNSHFSNSILSRIPSKKVNGSPSPSPSSSSSSLSLLSSSSSSACSHLVCSATSPSSTAGNELHDIGHDYSRKISSSSTTCFGPINVGLRRFRGYFYTKKSVKKVVLSIVGHS